MLAAILLMDTESVISYDKAALIKVVDFILYLKALKSPFMCKAVTARTP